LSALNRFWRPTWRITSGRYCFNWRKFQG